MQRWQILVHWCQNVVRRADEEVQFGESSSAWQLQSSLQMAMSVGVLRRSLRSEVQSGHVLDTMQRL
jgi:hypothetical protein